MISQICSGCKHTGLYYWNDICKSSDPPGYFGIGKAPSGMLCPVWGTFQCSDKLKNPLESSKNYRSRKHDLQGRVGRPGII